MPTFVGSACAWVDLELDSTVGTADTAAQVVACNTAVAAQATAMPGQDRPHTDYRSSPRCTVVPVAAVGIAFVVVGYAG